MPSAQPVYQPTTVTYERQDKEWSTNYLTESTNICRTKPCIQKLLLIFSSLFTILGLVMTIYALVNDATTHTEEGSNGQSEIDDGSKVDGSEYSDDTNPLKDEEHGQLHDHETNVILGTLGIFFLLVGIALYVAFLRVRGNCPWMCPSSRSATNNSSNGASGTIIPNRQVGDSSVIPVSYHAIPDASVVPIEEERHSLMGDKDVNGDDTERMMNNDPRIVLKPFKQTEEA